MASFDQVKLSRTFKTRNCSRTNNDEDDDDADGDDAVDRRRKLGT